MKTTRPVLETTRRLCLVDQAYNKKSWHGTNLRGSLRGLSVQQATWRPGPGRHRIVDIVIHAAYWKYAVRRRLRGDPRGSFPLRGSDWFTLPEPLSAAAWRAYVKLLDAEHRALRDAVAELAHEQLAETPAGRKTSHLTLIHGVAMHDVYHAGQVQFIKGLQKTGKPRRGGKQR